MNTLNMKKEYLKKANITTSLTLVILTLNFFHLHAQEYCSKSGTEQYRGEKDGYIYELWNQNAQGTACMTVGDGALFSGNWSDIQNYLARRGLGYDQTQEHYEYGRFYATYDCEYTPSSSSGNSYLSIYGWTIEPLIEFYIIEDWRNWIPSMAEGAISRGSITVNGSTYDIIENTQYDKPSIVGTATFQQYFSIRRNERNSGTINITDHFEQWEAMGMELGKLHEVAFVVEGYQSEGTFNFKELDVFTSNEALGIHSVNAPEPAEVYPNPSTGSITIRFDSQIKEATVNIYDTSGRIIQSQILPETKSLKVDDLTSGVYFVNINTEKHSYQSKLLVL